jgi:hypothetical protein
MAVRHRTVNFGRLPIEGQQAGDPCILVLLQLTEDDHALLREARQLARGSNEQIHLFHFARDTHRTGGMEFELAEHVRRTRSENARARRQVTSLAAELREQGFRVATTVVEGRPSSDSLRAALAAMAPVTIVVHRKPSPALRGVLNHGIRRLLLAGSAWLLTVEAGS